MTSIFEKLLCSDCKQYLSVFPIKVYPNHFVKCGRCSSDDDEGIISKLYETVAEKLEFPCINHYEGCKKLLKPEEVPLHEMTCIGTPMKCPVCFNSTEDPLKKAEDCFTFEGNSLQMIKHFKQKHNENFLKFPEFTISLNGKNEEKFYLYANNLEKTLGIICVRYDQIVNKLYLDIAPIFIEADHARRFTQKFELYSTNNNLIYKSTEKNCIRYIRYSGMNLNHGFNGIPMEEKYEDNVVICKFFIEEDEYIGFKSDLPKPEVNLSPSVSQTVAEPKPIVKEVIREIYFNNQRTFAFEPVEMCNISHHRDDNVMEFELDNHGSQTISYFFDNIRHLGKSRRYSPKFYLANTSWKMYIKKYFQKNTPYLAFFLVKDQNSDENNHSYKVNAKIEVLSYARKNEWENSFKGFIFGKRQNESMESGWNTFMPWNKLVDPNEKFICRNEGDIQIQVNMTLVKILKHKNCCNCSGCR